MEEFLPLREGGRVRIGWEFGGASVQLGGTVWSEDLAVQGATIVATYLDGPAAGKPSITRNAFGQGSGWYVSTALGADDLATVLGSVYQDAGLAPRAVAEGLTVVVRQGSESDFIVALNHSDASIALSAQGHESCQLGRGDSQQPSR